MTDVEHARSWAAYYRSGGWNCLPSIPGRGRPAMARFSAERDEGLPEEDLDRWSSRAIQVCTGSRWGLVVVDLDGCLARDWWRVQPACPPTWTVRTRRGVHLWFSHRDPLPFKSYLWELKGVPHQAVEVLGDKNLAVAPPSPYRDGSGHYRFLPGLGPESLESPASLPGWVVDRVEEARRLPPTLALPRPPCRPLGGLSRCPYDRSAVLDSIPDKPALASSWGLRLATRYPNSAGWLSCHALGREDRNPSASFHADGGVYTDLRFGASLSLFDLAVALGAYSDWIAAAAALGHQYGAVARAC